MRLSFSNINAVKNADVQLNGLTVIAGENGTGKSTIGKLLFSIIKSLSNISAQKQDYKQKSISKYVDSLYKRMNAVVSQFENEDFNREFPLPSIKLVNQFMKIFNDEVLDHEVKVAMYREKLDSMRAVVDSIADFSPRMRKLISDDLKNIDICLEEDDNNAADMATEVKYMIESEFMNHICSLGESDADVELHLETEAEKVFFHLTNDDVTSVNMNINMNEMLQDATYVESPLYIHLLDSLLHSTTFRETAGAKARYRNTPMVPVHIKDLAEKIDAVRFVAEGSENELMIDAGGTFVFKDRSLYYEKDGIQHSPINVASGLKSFGVIQMLLETGAISEKKVLIWDEPENHLHPKWQITFASVLVALAKQGIPIVVSTHSPYFVQGIRYFSAKEDIENFVNYYLTENDRETCLSVVSEVTHDLNQIFVKLASPLNEIMNVDAVRYQK